jgi:hypothetical protein
VVGPPIALLSRFLFPFEPHFDTIQLSLHSTIKYLKMTVGNYSPSPLLK